MDPKLKKDFYNAVKKGIERTLEENPGIEYELDWFSIRAKTRD